MCKKMQLALSSERKDSGREPRWLTSLMVRVELGGDFSLVCLWYVYLPSWCHELLDMLRGDGAKTSIVQYQVCTFELTKNGGAFYGRRGGASTGSHGSLLPNRFLRFVRGRRRKKESTYPMAPSCCVSPAVMCERKTTRCKKRSTDYKWQEQRKAKPCSYLETLV